VSRLVRLETSVLFVEMCWLRVESGPHQTQLMQDHTETLRIGSKARDFSLKAANRPDEFTLTGLLASGILILEFLRGTW
jgi:hypothetical protein